MAVKIYASKNDEIIENSTGFYLFDEKGQYVKMNITEIPQGYIQKSKTWIDIPAELDEPCDECEDGIVHGTCSSCNGSGEGAYDGSRCHSCRGTGEEVYECECGYTTK